MGTSTTSFEVAEGTLSFIFTIHFYLAESMCKGYLCLLACYTFGSASISPIGSSSCREVIKSSFLCRAKQLFRFRSMSIQIIFMSSLAVQGNLAALSRLDAYHAGLFHGTAMLYRVLLTHL